MFSTALFSFESVSTDAWASVFGEVTSSLELAPEGTGYRMRTRFNKFINLPELIHLFKEVADIILPDMLDIKRPELKDGKYKIVVSEASDYVKKQSAFLSVPGTVHIPDKCFLLLYSVLNPYPLAHDYPKAGDLCPKVLLPR